MKQFIIKPVKYLVAILAISAIMILNVAAQSALKDNRKLYNVTEGRLAIKGYDPVSYFTNKRAEEGEKQMSYAYEGVTYRFSTVQHLESFRSDPVKYIPQYGGWCAYAMGATGEKVDIDPETFKLINGKLYLFYNRFFNNTKKSWDKDEIALKQKADAHWQRFVGNHK